VDLRSPDRHREVAERACRWVLDQVRYDDGPCIPASVADEPAGVPPWDRDGLHSGLGGVGLLLAEVRATRPWTTEEATLADAITVRLGDALGTQTDTSLFDGLTSTIAVVTALGAPGAEAAVARLSALATEDGWPPTGIHGPRYLPGVRIHDLTLGTSGVLAGAVWARRHGVPGADTLAEAAASVLVAEAATGRWDWAFVPERFLAEPPATLMPNLSHGIAGVATALALAGAELDRADLVELATRGAEHLVTLADLRDGGFVVPRTIPAAPDMDEVTFTWCHGPTGTSLLFLALEHAGVTEVAGEPPSAWHRRCLHSVRTSGLPARLRPGFWDNDGRCCGTAGVADVFLDSWHRSGDEDDAAFAVALADTLVERAVTGDRHAYWQFLEHRNEVPLLPPGVGWMQGAAGIAAYLFHVSRVLEDPAAGAVARIDNWWAV
jgi:hypothetical protein